MSFTLHSRLSRCAGLQQWNYRFDGVNSPLPAHQVTVYAGGGHRYVTTTTPVPGNGESAQTTTFSYDDMGRRIRTVLPDGASLTNQYDAQGHLLSASGARTYPAGYTFDSQGRVKTLTTWQDAGNTNTAATTTWNYDPYRGWLTGKNYQATNGPIYTYTAAGRLKTRAWARGLTNSYYYDPAGRLDWVSHSDASLDDTYGYDRQGRLVSLARWGRAINRSYDLAGHLLSESFNSNAVVNTYDAAGRRTSLSLYAEGSLVWEATFSYDSASGRLQTVTDVPTGLTATYSYLANSPLVSQITFGGNSPTVITTSQQFDNLNRLTRIQSSTGVSPVSDFQYGYNSANQRTNILLGPDNSRWAFGYDSLGQVTSGKKHWPDGTPVAGQQYEYQFDSIGNRTQTQAGGDNSGAGLRPASYTNNLLNQIVGRGVPGAADVLGIAHASASVTVNGQATSRKGEYFWKEVGANNTNSVVYLGITNQAVLAGVTNATNGSMLLPMAGQQYWYDADGNMLSDGVWTNTWDAENRLLSTETTSAVPLAARAKETWSYYSDGRWSERAVYAWTNGNWVAQATQRFVWDGIVIVAILDGNNGLLQTFLRGLDLSGTMQGAGGAGGLLGQPR